MSRQPYTIKQMVIVLSCNGFERSGLLCQDSRSPYKTNASPQHIGPKAPRCAINKLTAEIGSDLCTGETNAYDHCWWFKVGCQPKITRSPWSRVQRRYEGSPRDSPNFRPSLVTVRLSRGDPPPAKTHFAPTFEPYVRQKDTSCDLSLPRGNITLALRQPMSTSSCRDPRDRTTP